MTRELDATPLAGGADEAARVRATTGPPRCRMRWPCWAPMPEPSRWRRAEPDPGDEFPARCPAALVDLNQLTELSGIVLSRRTGGLADRRDDPAQRGRAEPAGPRPGTAPEPRCPSSPTARSEPGHAGRPRPRRSRGRASRGHGGAGCPPGRESTGQPGDLGPGVLHRAVRDRARTGRADHPGRDSAGASQSGAAFLAGAPHGDYALVGVAVVVTRDGESRRGGIVLFSVGEGPVRAGSAERALTGSRRPGGDPGGGGGGPAGYRSARDIHASAAYRRQLATVLTGRALTAAPRAPATRRP